MLYHRDTKVDQTIFPPQTTVLSNWNSRETFRGNLFASITNGSESDSSADRNCSSDKLAWYAVWPGSGQRPAGATYMLVGSSRLSHHSNGLTLTNSWVVKLSDPKRGAGAVGKAPWRPRRQGTILMGTLKRVSFRDYIKWSGIRL